MAAQVVAAQLMIELAGAKLAPPSTSPAAAATIHLRDARQRPVGAWWRARRSAEILTAWASRSPTRTMGWM